jgi:hypothetical protein
MDLTDLFSNGKIQWTGCMAGALWTGHVVGAHRSVAGWAFGSLELTSGG